MTMNLKFSIALVLILLFFLVPMAVFSSGAREIELGEAYPKACADCHSDNPKYPLLGVRLGYDTSGHKKNNNSYYANGTGCQQCHTNEGFIEYVDKGKVGEYVAYPSQPGCFTCHEPHTKGDFSLRTMKPVKLANGSVFDLGKGNLCANCHQARLNAQETVQASDAAKITSHWGGHHGPQSDMVSGTNAWEFPGKSYSSSAHKLVVKDGCAQCHMALPKGRYGFSPELGGHSFNIEGEVHEAGLLNVTACVACHKDIKQVRGEEIFDLKAKVDYDQDGNLEPLQQEVQGILETFVNEKGTGYLQTINPPMFKKDAKPTFEGLGDWAGSRTGSWTKEQMAALYNYKYVVEDRSKGVHNSTYAIQILYDSLKALDPSLDDSRRPK